MAEGGSVKVFERSEAYRANYDRIFGKSCRCSLKAKPMICNHRDGCSSHPGGSMAVMRVPVPLTFGNVVALSDGMPF